MLSASDKSDSINECTHTDEQQKILYIFGVFRKCPWINSTAG